MATESKMRSGRSTAAPKIPPPTTETHYEGHVVYGWAFVNRIPAADHLKFVVAAYAQRRIPIRARAAIIAQATINGDRYREQVSCAYGSPIGAIQYLDTWERRPSSAGVVEIQSHDVVREQYWVEILLLEKNDAKFRPWESPSGSRSGNARPGRRVGQAGATQHRGKAARAGAGAGASLASRLLRQLAGGGRSLLQLYAANPSAPKPSVRRALYGLAAQGKIHKHVKSGKWNIE